MIDFQICEIAEKTAAFGVELNKEMTDRLNRYGNLLLSCNERVNLTAITQPREVLYKHFYDCILFLKAVDVPFDSSLIDVGTGAGFPGLVLKLVRPDLNVTLLDSLQKRLRFLEDVIADLGLSGVTTLHARAEDAGKDPLYRERYDFSCARAVAPLGRLAEYCLPFVKPGGVFVAMKGANAEEEIAEACGACRLLGGGDPSVTCETLTGEEKRAFVTVKKISQTPTKYPRKPSEIAKQPL